MGAERARAARAAAGVRNLRATARRFTPSFILQLLLLWPDAQQRRQRTGSRQAATWWSVARQRKQPLAGFRVLQVETVEVLGAGGESAASR